MMDLPVYAEKSLQARHFVSYMKGVDAVHAVGIALGQITIWPVVEPGTSI
jgi:hypothetical protein